MIYELDTLFDVHVVIDEEIYDISINIGYKQRDIFGDYILLMS